MAGLRLRADIMVCNKCAWMTPLATFLQQENPTQSAKISLWPQARALRDHSKNVLRNTDDLAQIRLILVLSSIHATEVVPSP